MIFYMVKDHILRINFNTSAMSGKVIMGYKQGWKTVLIWLSNNRQGGKHWPPTHYYLSRKHSNNGQLMQKVLKYQKVMPQISWPCSKYLVKYAGYWTKVVKYPPEWAVPMRGIFYTLSSISSVFNKIFWAWSWYFATFCIDCLLFVEVIMGWRAYVCHLSHC